MRSWKLAAGDPLQLSLAADARLGQTSYANDVIWQIALGDGEPPAIAAQTTFGLRARWMQIFPCFTRLGKTRIDPATFHKAPVLTQFYASYLCLECVPFEGVEVKLEYWASSGHVLTGRIEMTNKTILPQNIRLELAALLTPLGAGEGMAALPMGLGHALQGQSGRLAVVCALGGGAQPGKSAYPSLAVQTELYPAGTHVTRWAVGAADNAEAAYELARSACNRPWEAELARIELRGAAELAEIQTGIPDWDAALALALKTARGLIQADTDHLPKPSFVLARRTDHGASARGDGSDAPLLWRGQTAFDSYFFASLLLPGSAGLVRGLVENFLHTQSEQGYADWRPGLGGQRGHLLAQPLLAALALRGAPTNQEDDWLAVMYAGLMQFFRSWFSEEHDRDSDNLPEWTHPFQIGIDGHPLFDRWREEAQGVDTSTVESPALGALLYRECISLIEIARRIGREEDLPWLSAQAAQIFSAVEETWDRKAACYSYRDAQTHLSLSGRGLLEFTGGGSYNVRRKLRATQRLVLQVKCSGEGTRAVTVTLRGTAEGGEVVEETLEPRDFTWSEGRGRVTTRACYLQIDQMEINGLQDADSGWLRSIDLTQLDISLLLPFWAGIPNAKRAAAIVQHHILGGWLEPYGLALCPAGERPDGNPELDCTAIPWNAMIIEGLLSYGYRTEAAELFSRLMNACLHSLKKEHAFRQFYQAIDGSGQGERDHLWGLPPVELFLRIAGIEKLQSDELIVRDFNPFPWPVTVKYQRMTISREGEKTTISLPGRQPLELSGREARKISLSGSAPEKEVG